MFNDNMEIVPSESNEKVNTQYDYYAIPVLFCPRNILDEIVYTLAMVMFQLI